MRLFEPSKLILKKIITELDNENEIISNYCTFCDILERSTLIREETRVIGVIGSIPSKLDAFYALSSAKEIYHKNKGKILEKILPTAGESIKNCYDHGPKDKDIVFRLFLGNAGICYGFYDGGDYFKDKKIKHQWENKIEITEFDKNTPNNFKCGVNSFIFPYTDFIYVDSTKGILYLVCLMDTTKVL